MTLHRTAHKDWFRIGLAMVVFAVGMMFASLLIPGDDDGSESADADMF